MIAPVWDKVGYVFPHPDPNRYKVRWTNGNSLEPISQDQIEKMGFEIDDGTLWKISGFICEGCQNEPLYNRTEKLYYCPVCKVTMEEYT